VLAVGFSCVIVEMVGACKVGVGVLLSTLSCVADVWMVVVPPTLVSDPAARMSHKRRTPVVREHGNLKSD